jgi:ATP-dependent DNA helicase RecG
LRRDDDPPDYISFREAAINLLIHQDFGDHTRVPVIRIFRDCAEFFNPGDAFASAEQLLDPGDKEVRNPSVVNAFRRVGLSDQGGTGVGAIFEGWRKLGYVPPEIENNKAEKSFRLRLSKEKLLSEAQLLAQASLGMNLSEHEAAVFAYLIRQGQVDLADIKGLTGMTGPAALLLVRRLTVQALLAPMTEGVHLYTLAEHLRHRFMPSSASITTKNQQVIETVVSGLTTEQATVQVATEATEQVRGLVQLSSTQWLIIEHADTPRTLSELLGITGYKQRPHFKAQHLEPLLAGCVIRMTVPDKPTSSKQQYVLTDIGVKLKAMRMQGKLATEQEPV